ncbi:MAG TPA: DUF2460 domain-containing protein, partial [Caulobacteraceae bacterium]|nr:DUF2460 domain-containing protein [Caulobacteraceae bacterium]
FKSCAPGGTVSASDQTLGVGDGTRTAFQLVKAYGEVAREIRKPVAGTVVAALDGVATSDFTVDAASGVVTFADAPAAGVEVTAGFQFDTPVRFDTDRIDVTLEGFEAGRVVAAPLIEVRV